MFKYQIMKFIQGPSEYGTIEIWFCMWNSKPIPKICPKTVFSFLDNPFYLVIGIRGLYKNIPQVRAQLTIY